MGVNKIRVLEGINIKKRKKLIYISIDKCEDKWLIERIKKYIKICNFLSIDGKIHEENYIDDEYEVYITYLIEDVSLYIIEELLKNENEKKIILGAKRKIQNSWYLLIEKKCKDNNIPIIKISNKEIQLGYGYNSFKLNKETFTKTYKKNISIIIDKIINEKHKGQIPIISVTGTNGKTSTVRLIYKLLRMLGYKCGLSSTGGIFINDNNIKNGDTTGFYSARMVLKENIEVAVLETARGGIIKKGLGYEYCNVGIITSLSEDHIGMAGINSLEQLANVKKLIGDNIVEDGTLIVRATDILVNLFRKRKNLILFDNNKNDFIKNHINCGGSAIYEEDNYIIFNKGGRESRVVDIRKIPFCYKGISKSNVRNVMASIVAIDTIYNNHKNIAKVLQELECDLYINPGRQNIISIENYKLMLDYGHNKEAFEEVFTIAKSLNPSKITAIIAAAGDRRDEDIKDLGRAASKFCDNIIIREQADRRGRKIGETAKLIENALIDEGFNCENIQIIHKEEEAIIQAMKNAVNNELIIIFTQCLNVIIPAINKYILSRGGKIIGEGIDFNH